MTFTFVGVVSQ